MGTKKVYGIATLDFCLGDDLKECCEVACIVAKINGITEVRFIANQHAFIATKTSTPENMMDNFHEHCKI